MKKNAKSVFFYLPLCEKYGIKTPSTKTTHNMNSNTKNSIVNLAEYGIELNSIAGFLNDRMYSDCHSFVIYNVNGKKAMAVEVEREFKPEWAGAYHCTNNIEQYRAPIKLVGKPFEVELNRGNWGKWCNDFIGGMWARRENEKIGEVQDGYMIVEWGDVYVRAARVLPSGKPARKFHKYSQIEEHCGQFNDYNF